MRKFLMSLCLATACVCTIAAAGCEKTTYTVTFNAGYGTFDDGEFSRSVLVKEGKRVDEQAAQRPGWKFEYWAQNGEEFDFNKKVDSSIVLDAVYSPVDFHTVSFDIPNGASIDYSGIGYEVTSLDEVPTISLAITVELDAFFMGAPILTVNGGDSYNSIDGVFTVPITEDSVITVSGVRDAVSTMSGTGINGDPFMVSTPIDLIYIAEKVNSGDNTYANAYYELANDIDLKGHELQVIGDGRDLASGSYASFGGYFNGAGYTIRNFEINTDDTLYVGLFGIMTSGTNSSTAATVINLNLDNYEINAQTTNVDTDITGGASIFCGSFVGYGVGANVLVCSTTNGTINLMSSDNYFSYVGGAIGYQRSAYLQEFNVGYIAAVSYARISAEIRVSEGRIFAAGGIVGYMTGDAEVSPAYVNHSYTDCTIEGALNAGGIIGYMERFTSVVDCYATGDVGAQAPYTNAGNREQYIDAYAGGIVGYAMNDTMIMESFATGDVSAYTDYENMGGQAVANGICGGKDAVNTAEMGATEFLAYNCYYAEDGVDGNVNLTSVQFLKESLNWKDYDWSFVEGEYPTINLTETSVQFMVTIEFGANNKVDNYAKNVLAISDIYLPIGLWAANGDLNESYVSDDGKIAVGFYFDPQFTQKVPTSYVPTRNITLYLNFVDYTDVAGTYYLLTPSNNYAQLQLNADGTFSYTDGNSISVSTYVYDDSTDTILFNDARFARYSNASLSIDKYKLKNFLAAVENGNLSIVDNVFFTQTAPLYASNTAPVAGEYYFVNGGNVEYYVFNADYTGYSIINNQTTEFEYTLDGDTIFVGTTEYGTFSQGVVTVGGNTLNKFDSFHGNWELSLTLQETWEFNSVNKTWKHTIFTKTPVVTVGTYDYESNPDEIVLSTDSVSGYATAIINNGILEVTLSQNTVAYNRENSFVGTWQDYYHGAVIELQGLNATGAGVGKMTYGGYVYDVVYQEENGVVTVYENNEIFAYLTYDNATNSMIVEFNIEDDLAETTVLRMWRYDEYRGEWISDNQLFETVSFNGYGAYNTVYTIESYPPANIKGYVTIGEDRVPYTLTDDYLGATFEYKNVVYTMAYDKVTNKISLTGGTEPIVLERHDDYKEISLIDSDNTVVTFNGRGNLASGVMTATQKDGSSMQFTYSFDQDGIAVYQLNSTTLLYHIYKDDTYYVADTGTMTRNLWVNTVFTGSWGISGLYGELAIGGEDLKGNISGTYLGQQVTFTKIDEIRLSFNTGKSTIFVFAVDKNTIAISPYDNLSYGGYTICGRTDKMFGEWKMTAGTFEITLFFDGTGLSDWVFESIYGGHAIITHRGVSVEYLYVFDGEDILLYAVNPINGYYYNYKVQWVDVTNPLAYVKGDKAIRLIQIDSLYDTTLTDDEDVSYSFDGMGTCETSEGDTYSYQITKYDENSKTVTVLLGDGTTEWEIILPLN